MPIPIGSEGAKVTLVGVAQTPTGDFDGDGKINFKDFVSFAQAFGTSQGNPRYDARFDMNQDGSVNFKDFVLFARAFGTTPAG